MRHNIFGILLLWCALACGAQGWTAPSALVQSVQMQVEGYPLSPAIIAADSNERVTLSFDIIGEDREYLRYELIHCNALWQPSGLVDSEFLDGFNYGDIEDYDYSRNTLTHYVHYSVSFPNAQVRPLISGNYEVRVYPQDDPEQTLLTARFCVTERAVEVLADVTSRTDIDYNGAHQQVSLVVDAHEYAVEDLFNDLVVVVEQNGRTDNRAVVTHPLRLNGRKAVYEHLRPLIFEAGNEYRRMETVSTTYPGMGVEHISYVDPLYHFDLHTDLPRANRQYLYDQTQHGRYFVREYNSAESDTEADYVVVHFTLDTGSRVNGEVYLDSDATGRRFDSSSRMTWDETSRCYRLTKVLKQGAYNYQYLVMPPGATTATTAIVEGNYYPTVNEYVIKVYHRPRGTRYDRLVGVTSVFSGK